MNQVRQVLNFDLIFFQDGRINRSFKGNKFFVKVNSYLEKDTPYNLGVASGLEVYQRRLLVFLCIHVLYNMV